MKSYTLITGASSGIGLELARVAAAEKQNLLLVARDEPQLKTVAKELKKQKVAVEYLAVDLSKSTSAKKVFEFCAQKKIFVDTLINNAGFGDYGNFAQSDLKKQLGMINLNVRSLTELTHLFLPAMLEEGSGKIMNLGSTAAFLPGPLMDVYYATKHYVLAFSEGLAEELRGTGVSVTCLCPGPTKTKFSSAANANDTKIFKGTLPTAAEVAHFGWYHLQNGSRVAIYGRGSRFMIQASKFVPRSLLTRVVKKIQS